MADPKYHTVQTGEDPKDRESYSTQPVAAAPEPSAANVGNARRSRAAPKTTATKNKGARKPK